MLKIDDLHRLNNLSVSLDEKKMKLKESDSNGNN